MSAIDERNALLAVQASKANELFYNWLVAKKGNDIFQDVLELITQKGFLKPDILEKAIIAAHKKKPSDDDYLLILILQFFYSEHEENDDLSLQYIKTMAHVALAGSVVWHAAQLMADNRDEEAYNLLNNDRTAIAIAAMRVQDLSHYETGRKGGQQSKKADWAEELGQRLASDNPDLTKEQLWKTIPVGRVNEEENGLEDAMELMVGDERWEVCREDEFLLGVRDNDGTRKEIKKSTFMRRYLKKR